MASSGWQSSYCLISTGWNMRIIFKTYQNKTKKFRLFDSQISRHGSQLIELITHYHWLSLRLSALLFSTTDYGICLHFLSHHSQQVWNPGYFYLYITKEDVKFVKEVQ